jgi:ATP-dependent 26S proteasome regulatory subunit
VAFPFPDRSARRRIWAGIWPPEAPVARDVDLDRLAGEFELSGGNIRNVALAAAFLAAAEHEPISMRHVARGLRREYQKLGRPLDDVEWLAEDADPGSPGTSALADRPHS